MTTPLLIVTLLFRSKPPFSALSHVIDAVSLYADASVQLPLAKASKFGSLTLLNRIWDCKLDLELISTSWSLRGLLRSQPLYQSYQASLALIEAVKHRDLHMIQWIVDRFREFCVPEEAVQTAAANGDLPLLRYFLESDCDVCWGNLDMAGAAAAGHANVVSWLQTTQDQVQILRNREATVLAATANGNLQLVQLVAQIMRISVKQSTRCLVAAAANGHLPVVEWLHSHLSGRCPAGLLLTAAAKNHLHVVQWIIERDLRNNELDSDSDDPYQEDIYTWERDLDDRRYCSHVTNIGGEASLALHAAAVNGHLAVAKYLHAIVARPQNREDERRQSQRLRATIHAIQVQIGDNCDLLQTISHNTMLHAAKKGLFAVVQWLYTEFHPKINILAGYEYVAGETFTTMDFAAINGHFDILLYFHNIAQNGMRLNKSYSDSEDQRTAPFCTICAMDGAARNGHLEIVQWLHLNRKEGCTKVAMDCAAANGHLEIVQWLHLNRKEGCTKVAMDCAAANGHLEIVQWLHLNRKEGCTKAAMDCAAANGHLEIVQWLHLNRNEGCTKVAMDKAAGGGYLSIVKWLHDNTSEGCSTEAMDGAAACGALEIVKWLSRNRSEGASTAAMDEAARNGQIRVIRWLHENRSEGCTTAAMDNALLSEEFEVVLFLQKLRTEGLKEVREL